MENRKSPLLCTMNSNYFSHFSTPLPSSRITKDADEILHDAKTRKNMLVIDDQLSVSSTLDMLANELNNGNSFVCECNYLLSTPSNSSSACHTQRRATHSQFFFANESAEVTARVPESRKVLFRRSTLVSHEDRFSYDDVEIDHSEYQGTLGVIPAHTSIPSLSHSLEDELFSPADLQSTYVKDDCMQDDTFYPEHILLPRLI